MYWTDREWALHFPVFNVYMVTPAGLSQKILMKASALTGSFDQAQLANDMKVCVDQSPSQYNLSNFSTRDVKRLLGFYHHILQSSPSFGDSVHSEFHTGVGVLAIFAREGQLKYIPHRPKQRQTKARF
jgi:hypothetical protein